MILNEGYMPFKGYKTYYRIVGKASNKPPLVLLHGGPGSSHNYFEVLDKLTQKDNRQIIMYDQLGCGKSSIPDDHPELYNKITWTEELITLRKYLNLDQIHLLGQSWGGMLAIIYMCDYHPMGIKSLILSSTLSSVKLWSQELHRLITYLPKNEQEAIRIAEEYDDFSGKAYQKANNHFMSQHVIKITSNLPEAVLRKKNGSNIAYNTAWGPNEYTPEGNLRNYEYTTKLKNITTPTLITNGTDDLCTPLVAKTMVDHLPNNSWKLFAGCGHMPFVQKTECYINLLIKWMIEND